MAWSLGTWNWVAAFVFGALFIVCIVALAVKHRLGVAIPVGDTVVQPPEPVSSTEGPATDDAAGPTALGVTTEEAGNMALAPFLFIFIGVTCMAHVCYAVSARREGWYMKAIEDGHMPYRWLEYGLTATVMALLIASFSGVRDRATLVLVGTLCSILMGMGYLAERALRATEPGESALRNPSVMVPTVLGWAAFVGIWGVITVAFFRTLKRGRDAGVKPPAWITAIFWTQLAAFGCFGVIQLVQIFLRPKFAAIEKAYITASLSAKATLAGLFLGGLVFA